MKKTSIIIIVLIVFCGVAAYSGDGDATKYQNLKVLPKHISSKQLQQIMVDEFNTGLGVGCGFCHAEVKGSHRLDYASDGKPEKAMARMMLRMTLKINRQDFGVRHPQLAGDGMIVTCVTCHKGSPRME